MAISATQAVRSDDAVGAAWARVRQNLRHSAGQRLFDQWLKPAELIDGCDGEDVRIGLPSAFAATWVRSHYADRLLLEFRAALPNVRSVSVEALPTGAARRLVVAPVEVEAVEAPAPGIDLGGTLDARFTFDRFVVDASNRVAFNAARALAAPGRPRFSPLYLHAGTGQGKTHLMHAVGNAFVAASPGASALYMPAERFMFEFVQALRARDTHAFKVRLRGVDLLMIDDLQFIAGKDATQEEFFHTVDAFMGADKRLVIAADRPPTALEAIEPRLVSRLGAGLVADIRPPELELRRAILAQKLSEAPDAAVPAEVTALLADRITASVRELEGALTRVIAYAQLTGEEITLDFATATLGEVLKGAQRRVTIDEIQRAVSTHFSLKPVDLLSARRAVAVARPRQIAMYLSKRLTTRSLPEIGRRFGGRDHSTVIHAVRRIEALRGSDRDIDGAVNALLRQLER